MHLDLSDEETAVLLREFDGIIDGDRYFLSRRIKTLRGSVGCYLNNAKAERSRNTQVKRRFRFGSD